MFKYKLNYLPYKSPYLTDDIVDIIHQKIHDIETMREYFLIWSFKTPESNKIMISNELMNINQYLRTYEKELKDIYDKYDDIDKPASLNCSELIKYIQHNNNIDTNNLFIKISNKIVCRYFNINENRKIKRHLKETGEYAVFFKMLLKSIILKNIFPDNFYFELKYLCKRYYSVFIDKNR